MSAREIFTLDLGLQAPWKIVGQHLDMDLEPQVMVLSLGADRGAEYPCPKCGRACKAKDFKTIEWRHLNFLEYHCKITARVPRVGCPEHGVKRIIVPWARPNSGFTLLFEQLVISLCREMPVSTAARHLGVTDHRLWRVLAHYGVVLIAKTRRNS